MVRHCICDLYITRRWLVKYKSPLVQYLTIITLHHMPMRGMEYNNYGEILHEWAFVFHEPTASDTARRVIGRGAVCACHIYRIRVGCGFSVLSVFCRDGLPWTPSWDHFWMRDAVAYRGFPVTESVDTLATE